MGKVALEGLEFFAFHGFHEEEKKIGNRYGVDIIVEADFEEASVSDDLVRTVDYAQLYAVINSEMQQPSSLLEHVARRIVAQVFKVFSQVVVVEITVSKYNPPIGGICNRAYVKLKQIRESS